MANVRPCTNAPHGRRQAIPLDGGYTKYVYDCPHCGAHHEFDDRPKVVKLSTEGAKRAERQAEHKDWKSRRLKATRTE
jgi:hypothetical protein